MDRPQKRMSNKKFAAIATVAIVVPCIVVIGFYYEPYTWGGNGTLTLSISLDRTEMTAKESIKATLVLKNTGSEKVRVLQYRGDAEFGVYLVNESGDKVREMKPAYATMKTGPTPYNNYMTVLEPGATMTYTTSIQNSSHWLIPANHTYTVFGTYYSEALSQSGVLPHWTGTLETQPVQMTMKP